MAFYYDWAFRWLQSLLALQICSVSQKIHKNCEKNENFPSKSQKMTFWCGRKKWRGRWTVNNSFNSLGLINLAYQRSHIYYSLWIGLLMIFHLHQWFKAKTWEISWFLVCYCYKRIRHESTKVLFGFMEYRTFKTLFE